MNNYDQLPLSMRHPFCRNNPLGQKPVKKKTGKRARPSRSGSLIPPYPPKESDRKDKRPAPVIVEQIDAGYETLRVKVDTECNSQK